VANRHAHNCIRDEVRHQRETPIVGLLVSCTFTVMRPYKLNFRYTDLTANGATTASAWSGGILQPQQRQTLHQRPAPLMNGRATSLDSEAAATLADEGGASPTVALPNPENRMKLKEHRMIVGATVLLTLSGCATVFSSGPQTLNLKSEPPGATYQYGPYSGKTPDTVQASRAELAHVTTFTLAGYESKTVGVETSVQGVTWVDVLFWPGFIVDFVTGNAYKVNTPDVTATLTPIAPTLAPAVQIQPTPPPAPFPVPVAALAPTPPQATQLPPLALHLNPNEVQ
jgi:hypothetical protein